MKNQYLEKLAAYRDVVPGILIEYNRRHNEIEEPIDRMHDDMNELEYAARGNDSSPYHSDLIEKIRSQQEDNLRNSLNTFEAHRTNKYNTAVKLLQEGGLPHHEGSFDSDHVINTFKAVHKERNEQIGLRNSSTIVGALGGAVLGGKSMGPLGAFIGGVAGSFAGSQLGDYAFKNRIADRAAEINKDYDNNLNQAYRFMKSHVSAGQV